MIRMFGERCSSQASVTRRVVAPNEAAAASSSGDCRGRKPPSGKKGNIGNPLFRQRVDEWVVLAMGKIVMVLHAHDLGDRLRLDELPLRDIAETNMADQALGLEVGQGS